MAPPSQHPAVRGAAPAERHERRSWLSHGLAALAISALGLGVAGSLASTSSAEDTSTPPPRTTVRLAPALPSATGEPVADPTATDPALAAFARRGQSADTQPTRGAGLRTAIAQEKAAQRSEELAKTAEAVTRTARTESSAARQQALSDAEQARQVASARIAAENLRRATAARLEAVAERRRAEQRQALLEAQQRAARERAAQQAQEQPPQPDPVPAEPVQPEASQPEPTRPEPDRPGPNRPQPTRSEPVSTGGGAVSPVPGAIIGSHFGQYGVWSRYHTGLDFRAAYGTPIRAVQAGTVLYAGNTGDWAGNHVAIRHADGKTTMSSHLSSMSVSSGATVAAGQVIGYVGQTGRAFGAHLHFELYPVGVRYGDVYSAINPQPWLAAAGVRTR